MDTDKTSAAPDERAADVAATGGGGEQTPATGAKGEAAPDMPREINGPKGPEPTRYGDWEQKGRCSDF